MIFFKNSGDLIAHSRDMFSGFKYLVYQPDDAPQQMSIVSCLLLVFDELNMTLLFVTVATSGSGNFEP